MPLLQSKPALRTNPAHDKAVAILRDKGYNRLDSFKREAQRGVNIPEDHWEIWAGPKGTLVLQVWKDGNGAHVLGTMGLGQTFDELAAAL